MVSGDAAAAAGRVLIGTEERAQLTLNGAGVYAGQCVAAMGLEVVVIAESQLSLWPLVGSGRPSEVNRAKCL